VPELHACCKHCDPADDFHVMWGRDAHDDPCGEGCDDSGDDDERCCGIDGLLVYVCCCDDGCECACAGCGCDD
jgi:hypothetical protein